VKYLLLLTFLLLFFDLCEAQRLNKAYYGLSSDSSRNEHLLEFKNDTTVEIRTFPRHMSKGFRMTLKYKTVNNAIEIYSDRYSHQDSVALRNSGFEQFLSTVTLTAKRKVLMDTSNKLLYALYNDFKDKYYLTYIIDGKVYKQETGLTDAYGLIKNRAKENKELQDKLTLIKNDLERYAIRVYKGVDAYKKFGYRSIFGVVELKRKG
jgi:hypothetical protein